MNSQCWDHIRMLLGNKHTVYVADLPGHGYYVNAPWSLRKLNTFIRHLIDTTPAQTLWVGWSLGGLIAQLAATQFPKHIRKFVSIAMAARFSSTRGWQAVDPRHLKKMHKQLNTAPAAECLQAFIAQQPCSAKVQEALLAMVHCPCVVGELQAGLDLLRTLDCRDAIATYSEPSLFITGDADTICPPLAVHNSAALSPHARCHTIPNAGHPLPLSHPQQVADQIEAFIQ